MGENFCLKWNDYDRNLTATFCELRSDAELLDITLTCDDDRQLHAHKVILSACSPFFRNILKRNPHEHPLLYLRGVKYKELEAILHFIYNGEVNVGQDELNEFLLVAEDLKIKGLTQSSTPEEPPQQQINKPKKEPKPNIPNIISIASLKRNNESLLNTPNASSVPGANKRQKLNTSSLLESKLLANARLQQSQNLFNSNSDVIVPGANSPNGVAGMDKDEVELEEDDIADITAEDGENEIYDESSIIEESYEAEEGEYISGAEGYQTESSYQTSATNNDRTESTTGLLTHRGYVSCPVCMKLMYRKNLARHVAVKHTNAEPVQCSLCEKMMKNGWSLKEHERKYHGIFQSDKVLVGE